MEHHEILKNVPLFANVSTQHLKGIAKSCTERSFRAGDPIVQQGKAGIGLYIIVKVKVVKTIETGEQMEIATHGPLEVIGEMAVLDGARRTADVIAVDDTTCLVLASWSFNAFIEAHPEACTEHAVMSVIGGTDVHEPTVHRVIVQ